ncbi:MAG: TlpA disulfide reductase family protein [Desulfohalobiaceae bacterium]
MSRIGNILWVLLGLALFLGAHPTYAQEPEEVNTRELLSSIRQAQGSVAIVNFWASWCAECKNEIQDLVELRDSYPEERLYIMGVSMDEKPEAMQRLLQRLEVNYPNYQAAGGVGQSFNVTGVPKTYVYDTKGDLELKEFGNLGLERLDELIQDLLQE